MSKKDYTGYKLCKIQTNSEAVADQLAAMNVDVWSYESNFLLGKANDVLLSPEQFARLNEAFKNSNDANSFSKATVSHFEVVSDDISKDM